MFWKKCDAGAYLGAENQFNVDLAFQIVRVWGGDVVLPPVEAVTGKIGNTGKEVSVGPSVLSEKQIHAPLRSS